MIVSEGTTRFLRGAAKEGQGRELQEALDENRMLVKTKKKEANMLAKSDSGSGSDKTEYETENSKDRKAGL